MKAKEEIDVKIHDASERWKKVESHDVNTDFRSPRTRCERSRQVVNTIDMKQSSARQQQVDYSFIAKKKSRCVFTAEFHVNSPLMFNSSVLIETLC